MRLDPYSQYNVDTIGIAVSEAGELIDPDGNAVLVVVVRDSDGTEVIPPTAATRDGVGLYSLKIGPTDVTAQKGTYSATWSWAVSGQSRTFPYQFEVVDPQPFFDALTGPEKQLVDNVYHSVSDGFDSTAGGPYAWELPQSAFRHETVARLMTTDATSYINYSSPKAFVPPFTVGAGGGRPFPEGWYGLLERACPTPETLVLRADLSWVSVGDLQPGERIIGFDEDLSGWGRAEPRYRTTVVVANEPRLRPCVEVETVDGTITVSEEHPFVVRWARIEGDWRATRRGWKQAKDLRPGLDQIYFLGQPWEHKESWEGRSFRRSTGSSTVVSVRQVGQREVAGIETGTRTLVTAGYLSHNTRHELFKHLATTYLEVPLPENIPVGHLNRRDYYDRWMRRADRERDELDHMVRMLKRDMRFGVKSRSMLLAGGIFPVSYLNPARPRWPYVLTRFY